MIARRLCAGALALMCAWGIGTMPAQAAVLSSAEVLTKTGKSIDAWGAAWWQWAFTHPEVLSDTTGASGGLGDVGGPVFFAEGSGGGAVTLDYRVPGNQFVLLPLATYIWTLFDPCADTDCAADIVNAFVSGTTGAYATIDGVPVTGFASHVVTVDKATPFVFQVDAGPIGPDGYGGILDAVQGGIWLMLDPLGPGLHTLTFGAIVPLIDPLTGDVLDDFVDLQTTLRLLAIPEPTPAMLLALGLVGWALASRSSRSRRRPLQVT